jgi:hypothetical protein
MNLAPVKLPPYRFTCIVTEVAAYIVGVGGIALAESFLGLIVCANARAAS